MRLLTRVNLNFKYLVNFLYILSFFALFQNFGINDLKYKVFYLSIGFLYFLSLFIKYKNLFFLMNFFLIFSFFYLGLFDFSYLFIQIFFLSIHPDFTTKYLKFRLKKEISFSNSFTKIFIPFFLLFLTLVTQNAYLTFEVIDHDVSTSIVVANDFFNGVLPYENSWDDKQPLFYFFNFILLFFVNKNFVLYKVIFDIFIFLNAYLIFIIVTRRYRQEIYKGLFSSTTYLCILSQPWSNVEYSEIMSSTFLGLSFYLFLNEEFKKVNYFYMGLLFGISTLINIGSAIFIFGFIFSILIYFKQSTFQRIRYFIFGVSSIHILLLFIYFFNDLLEIYLTTLIKIPLTYTTTDFYFFYDFRVFIEEIFTTNIFLFTIASILIFSIVNALSNNEKLFLIPFKSFIFLFFIFLSILFFYLAGKGFYHHLIYFVFFLPLAIIFIDWSNLLLVFSISFFMTIATYNLGLFKNSISNLANTEKIYQNYPLKQLSEQISNNLDDEFTILTLDHVLILFYLDRNNEIYIIHPTNHNEYFILNNLINGNFIDEEYLKDSLNSNPNVLICSNNDKGEIFYVIESIKYFSCSKEYLSSYLVYEFEKNVIKKGEYYPNYKKSTNIFINP